MRLCAEVLYPDIANLYGDTQNMRYLSLCLPELELKHTELNDKPSFATQDVDMIYMGPMPEIGQNQIVERLRPYRERLIELIEGGTVFLFTGNALEVLGERIANPVQEYELEGLQILPLRSEIALFGRYNGKVLGKFSGSDSNRADAQDQAHGLDIEIVGFKSQFSQVFGDNSKGCFLHCLRGAGINTESHLEGFVKNSLFATSLLGPLLILNPLFCKHLISLITPNDPIKLAFETEIFAAYKARLEEFKNLHTTGFDGKGH